MGLDSLLARRESRAADTPDTPRNPAEVSAKAAPLLGCTPDTPDSPRNDNAERQTDTETRPEWLVTLPTGERFTSSCTPPATLAEVRTWYPDALSIKGGTGDPGELAPEAILEPAAELPPDPSPWVDHYARWFAGIAEPRALATLSQAQTRAAVTAGLVSADLHRASVLIACRSPLGARGLLAIPRERYDAFKVAGALVEVEPDRGTAAGPSLEPTAQHSTKHQEATR